MGQACCSNDSNDPKTELQSYQNMSGKKFTSHEIYLIVKIQAGMRAFMARRKC